jgi:hypothetical protein
MQVKAAVTSATAAGRAVPVDRTDSGMTLLFHAPPAAGLTLTLTLATSGPVQIRAIDGSDGLDSLPGFIARPDGVGVRGSHTAELVLVGKTYTL